MSDEELTGDLSSFVDTSTKIGLLLDYDGTLSPIAKHPDLAVLPPKTKEILERLAANPDIFIAVISGRNVNDVKSKVGIDGITYAGKIRFQNRAILSKSGHFREPRSRNSPSRRPALRPSFAGSKAEDWRFEKSSGRRGLPRWRLDRGQGPDLDLPLSKRRGRQASAACGACQRDHWRVRIQGKSKSR